MIISAWPGCGKSYLARKEPKLFWDGEVTRFKNKYGDNVLNYNPPYVEAVKKQLADGKIPLVSAHDYTKSALKEAGLEFWSVIPSPHLKNEWIDRVRNRKTKQANGVIADVMAKNWDAWYDHAFDWTPAGVIILRSGQYLMDRLVLISVINDCERKWGGSHSLQEGGTIHQAMVTGKGGVFLPDSVSPPTKIDPPGKALGGGR